jgi:hypothetical protein
MYVGGFFWGGSCTCFYLIRVLCYHMGHWNVLLFIYISTTTEILITGTKLREFIIPFTTTLQFCAYPKPGSRFPSCHFFWGFAAVRVVYFYAPQLKVGACSFIHARSSVVHLTPLIIFTLESFNLQDICT